MTSSPRFSFRDVPPAIYVGLALNAFGTLTRMLAELSVSGERYEQYEALERWRLLDLGCDAASAILITLGLLELARRLTGARRGLVQAGAALSLASLAWIATRPVIALANPTGEKLSSFYDWLSRGSSLLVLGSAVLLAFGANAWRRAPVAAAGLVALGVTSYGIPIIGPAILKVVFEDSNSTLRILYALGRITAYLVATVFLAATLAADGRDPAPDPRAAASGLRLARGVLIFRLVAAIVIAMVMVVGRSPNAAKLVLFTGPAVVVITMVLFAIGLHRAAAARLDGMPRLLLSVAAGLTLWWGAIQLDQVSSLLELLKNSYRGERAMRTVQYFSIAGPLVAMIGLALVGSAISAFAARRGDGELRTYAYGRTITFLVLSLVAIGLQHSMTSATSLGSILMMVVVAATATIASLLVLAALLLRAADAVESEPGLPTARIV